MGLHKQDFIFFAPPVKSGAIGGAQNYLLRPKRQKRTIGNAQYVPLQVPQNLNHNGQREVQKNDEDTEMG